MIKNYFKIAFRLLWRNKLYSLINIIGLAIGLCSSIIIYLYVQHEFSYDTFHDDSERIYRFIMLEEDNGSILEHPYCRLPLAPALKSDYPEVEMVTRVRESSMDFLYDENVFPESKLLYADTSFFTMFNFPLIEGNPRSVLNSLNSIVLSKSFAKKIFGDVDPIGKSIRSLSGYDLMVTGIAEDAPSNTRFKFDVIAAVNLFVDKGNFNFSWDGGPEFNTYVKLKANINPESLNSKFSSFFKKYLSYSEENGYLQAIKDIHLHSSHFAFTNTEKRYSEVILFAIISVFILFIAIINYVNLSTARSIERAKEIGVKKVLGASRLVLIRQFFAESYLIVLFSIFLALIFIEVFLPYINGLLNENLSLYDGKSYDVLLILASFYIIVGALSAIYPALFLSSFKPIKVLKGGQSAKGKSKFRIALVVFQFIISSILISGTIYSVQQLNYILNKDRGYDQQNLMAIYLSSKTLRQKQNVIKNEILNLSGVVNAAASSNYPAYGFTANGYLAEGFSDFMLIKLLEVDPDYFKTMKMNIVDGREFSDELVTDERKFIINETLAKKLNWDNAVGKIITRNNEKHSVIGVLEDFHFKSLQSKIEPLIITVRAYNNYNYWVLNIRLDGKNNAETLEKIKEIFNETDHVQVFDYTFLDDQYKEIYSSEISFSKLFQLFSFLAIFIACLGLFGLAAYTAEQRTKEIGVRKVLGASSKSLLMLLSRQYFYIILIANAIAIPITMYLLQNWQNNYAYHVEISVILFLVTILISFIIAAFIVIMLSVKAASQNPVEALKYE